MRIAVCGFQHETNTFLPALTDRADFERQKDLPGLKAGADVLELAGSVLPIGGAIATLQEAGVDIVPLLWCFATPSGTVARSAFESILGDICDRLRAAGPLDGIFVELHGAMVSEDFEDGDAEVLRRIREIVGPTIPIAVSLDLHANVTQEMVDLGDFMDAYRRYPHTDMAETGARVTQKLLGMIDSGTRPAKAFRKLDFLIPLNGGCTDVEPASTLYRTVVPDTLEVHPGAVGCAFAAGFPFSDIYQVGPAAFAYAETAEIAAACADQLTAWASSNEPGFMPEVLQPDNAVARALRDASGSEGPIILVDTQDNPGAGGPSDTVGLLEALVNAGAAGAVFATLIDAGAANVAHELGIGRSGRFRLGGGSLPGARPFETDACVIALADGPFMATGPMFRGLQFNFGRMAVIETPERVRIVLGSHAAQTADQSVLRHVGLEPKNLGVLVIKSSTHFRADFSPIASRIDLVDAPGIAPVDPSRLQFRKARPDLRLSPESTRKLGQVDGLDAPVNGKIVCQSDKR